MSRTLIHALFFFLSLGKFIHAQTVSSSQSGYVGYSLAVTGDPDSTDYVTDETDTGGDPSAPPPDVYLNASVQVDEIDITVSNLTAKINLDAQVLNLLQFNAGIDLSIDRVELLIQNVTAKVVLEARLENVVAMINDTLSSIDLNPIIATLGEDLGSIVGDATGAIGTLTGSGSGSGTGTSSNATKRDLNGQQFPILSNILYSVNDYTGNTHTNRVLTQSGTIVDEFLHNNGQVYNEQYVGSYLTNMTFSGYNHSTVENGQVVRELRYNYNPFPGLSVVSSIYMTMTGSVVGTQVISDFGAEGTSTIGDS